MVFSEKEFSIKRISCYRGGKDCGRGLLMIFITAGVIAVRALASDSYLRSAKEADYFKQPENAAGYAAQGNKDYAVERRRAVFLRPGDGQTGQKSRR